MSVLIVLIAMDTSDEHHLGGASLNNMSVDEEIEAVDTLCSCCASCGIAEIDDIKLNECDHCDLVRYCSDECQNNHKSEHEEECKKRAAELRDEILFKQPESTHLGDCPICRLPLSIDPTKSIMNRCCFKVICNGCSRANMIREIEGRLEHTCAFCREPMPKTWEEEIKRRMKRIEANDPAAINEEGALRLCKRDFISAFEHCSKAAELGSVEAHYYLSVMYHEGHGVEKDEGEFKRNAEEAAIAGHPDARHDLGVHEWNNGNDDRAVKHWIIAATQGCDKSIKMLMKAFKEECLSKEDLAAALRAQKATADATKSPMREVADEIVRKSMQDKQPEIFLCR